MKNLTCGSGCLRPRTIVRGCLVSSSVLLLLLLLCFPFFVCFLFFGCFRRGAVCLCSSAFMAAAYQASISIVLTESALTKKEDAQRLQPHPLMGAPRSRICCSSRTSSTALARPRQEASTFKHMQPPQQTHRVPRIATHMRVSSQQLIFYQQGGPQVPAQLVVQHTSKVWLHSTNPFRTTSAACPSKSVARNSSR